MMKSDLEIIRSLRKDWAKAKIKRAGGQTNRNYIVECQNKKFFVRLPWETDVINRSIEAKNILALSRNKKVSAILPKYYLYVCKKKNTLDPKGQKIYQAPDGTMITEYISGKISTLSLFKKKRYQEKLAKMFYAFHSSGVRFVNKYDVFRDEIEKYRKTALKHPSPSFISKKIVSKLEQIEKEVKKEVFLLKNGVPAHNDFIFQNFIVSKNGKIYLLDFEYAGMNEKGGKLYDFAFLFADNFFRKPVISRDLFEKFLKIADRVYDEKLDRKQIWSLILAVPVMQIWWSLLRYSDAKTKKEKEYFRDYIGGRVKKINYLYKLATKRG